MLGMGLHDSAGGRVLLHLDLAFLGDTYIIIAYLLSALSYAPPHTLNI